MRGKKPYLVVMLIQLIYAGYFLLTKLALDVGMNTCVFVFYRQAAATLFLVPITIILERKSAPPLSFSLTIKIFLLSLIGITMSLNIVGVALKYTSASLGAATSNTLPIITFFLAVLLRMESVKPRTGPGIMKLGGVILCLAGVATIAFFKGPLLKLLVHHHLISSRIGEMQQEQAPAADSWVKGVFLMMFSNVTWALWLLLQGRLLKGFPSKLLLTTLQCLLSTIQSFLVALVFARDLAQWKLGFDVQLLSIFYCGVVVTGVTFYLQAWVIEKKGPIFLVMTTPLIMIFTITISALVCGEIITLGSVLGGILLVGGLYCVLWGKMKEEEIAKGECNPKVVDEKASSLV
ncbi:WAT1-related protein At5g64700-like [Primulina eburnea]|uniref:WAT1-related protein At5g64700-like n=1 Tax=Primulina eburnea TaxID=1245227 RepID=UPI003C6C412E